MIRVLANSVVDWWHGVNLLCVYYLYVYICKTSAHVFVCLFICLSCKVFWDAESTLQIPCYYYQFQTQQWQSVFIVTTDFTIYH